MAPEYQGFQNLQVGKLDMKQSLVSANLKFYNPNNFDVKLKKAEMDVFINDKQANHYVIDSTIFISRRDTFYIPISLQLDIGNLFSNALQSLINNQVHIRLEGYVKLKKGIVGYKAPLHYEITQKLDDIINER